MTPDTNSTGQRRWFYFNMSGGVKGQTYRFRILNFSRNRNLYDKGMQVCVFSKKKFKKLGVEWERGCKAIRYFQNNEENLASLDPKTRARNVDFYSLEFEYTMLHDRDEISLAYCFPYTYEMLQHDTKHWERLSKKHRNL